MNTFFFFITESRAENTLISMLLIGSLALGENTYMLFAGREVRIGKNCARGFECGLGPYSRPRAQFFPIRTDLGPANNVFIFFVRRVL